MPSVDNRVVRMEFDNAAFERKISTTLTSLDKMNKALKFEGAGKGLAEVSAAASKVDVGTISAGIEGVSNKFLALSTIALTVLSNITGAALRAGASLAKSLTLDPVMAGFQEYETNMRSIQTVLANTKADGTNLEQVNAALDKLNEYSDKTIYNFGEMARNIGTFTAAGVDLDTSVQSIKGIANLAAISGSSSEQASTAMYQLSQAISTGTLRLMDWNSVTNAGMGGEVFQKALFESGKALKTIEGVPIDQTFEQWTAAGNSFRGSLEQGWLTSEVLTTTLQGFTGEMNEAQLMAKGFTAEQAANIIELGKTGVEAATKVRTFTQLMQTVKESIGSGWSASFRLLIGNFDEATNLFTSLSNTIGGFISKNADARNKFLQTWADLGGRMLAIEAIRLAFKRLGEILKPLSDAFRKVFPPITAERIVAIQWAIVNFLNGIAPAQSTIDKLKVIFEGFFSALKIGWTILKEGVKFIGEVVGALVSLGGNVDVLGFLSKIASFFTDLAKNLVKGDAIKDFFDDLFDKVQRIIPMIDDFKDKIVNMFAGFDPAVPDAVSDSMGRVAQRFDTVKDAFGKAADLWVPFSNAMKKIGAILDAIWEELKGFFSELGDKIATAMGEGNFDKVLDLINVGLLGGIAIILAKFFKKGIKFDIGGGILEKLSKIFEELTGVLSAMQAKLKAEALMKIATAIGILTASVLVLSLIDSAALTKALAAMAVGFGQLMGAFAILSKITLGPTSAASFAILAGGMILLATAILILAGAAKILGTMDWDNLAKGLIGVTVMIGALSLAVIPLSKNSGQMMSAGASLLVMAVAINILAIAVSKMAELSMGEIAKGLLGIMAGLIGISLALKLMPPGVEKQGLGLLFLAISLNGIARAIQMFANIDLGDLVKGIISISLALAGIGLAMNLMPTNLPITAAGLFILGLALVSIAGAIALFAAFSWSSLGQGLLGLAAALLILAIAGNAMSGAIGGAIAIGIMAVSLGLLARVLQEFSNLSWGDLLRGLLGIGIALAALAVAALLIQPAIPAMLLLGTALLVIGAGFALFGLGAQAVAKAFELFAKVGPKGAEAFVKALKAMGKAIPAFVTGLAEGLLELVKLIGDMAPVLMQTLGKLIGSLIDELVKLAPKLGKLMQALMEALLTYVEFYIPRLVEAGTNIIISLLEGLREAIPQIVTVVGEIITGFLDAMSTQLSEIVQSVADLFVNMITSVAEALGKVASTLLFGVAAAFITGFVSGLTSALPGPMNFFLNLVGKILGWIGDTLTSLVSKGVDIITGFWNGLGNAIGMVTTFFTGLGSKILGWVGDTLKTLVDKGYKIIVGFWNGIQDRWTGIVNWFKDIGGKIASAVGDLGGWLWDAGWDVLKGFWNGMKAIWDNIVDWLWGKIKALPGIILDFFGIKSPSKLMTEIGGNVMLGFGQGMIQEWKPIEKWVSNLGPEMAATFEEGMSSMTGVITGIAKEMSAIQDFSPTITPVLDLSLIARDAGKIGDYIETSNKLVPAVSMQHAQTIASTTHPVTEDPTETKGPNQVNFEQNIYAPEQLSTADIYKQTRNQLQMAKEELSIP